MAARRLSWGRRPSHRLSAVMSFDRGQTFRAEGDLSRAVCNTICITDGHEDRPARRRGRRRAAADPRADRSADLRGVEARTAVAAEGNRRAAEADGLGDLQAARYRTWRVRD